MLNYQIPEKKIVDMERIQMTCSRWRPFLWKQTCILFLNDWMTRSQRCWSISLEYLKIFSFNCCRVVGLFLLIQSLRCPQRKKSHGLRSGECGDHSNASLRLITFPPNLSRIQRREAVAVCAGAPSCWNHWLSKSTFRRLSRATNFFTTVKYRLEVTVWAFPRSSSKKKGPMTPRALIAIHTVHLTEWSGLSRT